MSLPPDHYKPPLDLDAVDVHLFDCEGKLLEEARRTLPDAAFAKLRQKCAIAALYRETLDSISVIRDQLEHTMEQCLHLNPELLGDISSVSLEYLVSEMTHSWQLKPPALAAERQLYSVYFAVEQDLEPLVALVAFLEQAIAETRHALQPHFPDAARNVDLQFAAVKLDWRHLQLQFARRKVQFCDARWNLVASRLVQGPSESYSGLLKQMVAQKCIAPEWLHKMPANSPVLAQLIGLGISRFTPMATPLSVLTLQFDVMSTPPTPYVVRPSRIPLLSDRFLPQDYPVIEKMKGPTRIPSIHPKSVCPRERLKSPQQYLKLPLQHSTRANLPRKEYKGLGSRPVPPTSRTSLGGWSYSARSPSKNFLRSPLRSPVKETARSMSRLEHIPVLQPPRTPTYSILNDY